jgi:hypothetical protein
MEAIWNANPNINTLFCFEDGNCFVKHGDAASHAKTTGATYKQVSRPTEGEEQIETKPTKKSNK